MFRIALCWCLLAGAVVAQPLPPQPSYNLQQTLQEATNANPDLAQARARIEQARASAEQVYVALNPTVTGNFSFYRTFLPVANQANGFTTFLNSLIPGFIPNNNGDPDTYTGGVVLNQTIYSFGKVRWQALAAKLQLKKTGQDYRSTLLTILQTAEKAYISVKTSESQLELVAQQQDLRQQFLVIARNRFKAGLIAEYDVIQSDTQVRSVELEMKNTTMQRDTARVALLVLMGHPEQQSSAHFEPMPDMLPPPPDLNAPLASALEHRPEVAALRWSLASAQASVEAAWHTNAPNLSFVTQYLNTQVPNQQPQPNWVAGLQLSANFYDGGQAKTLAEQAMGVVQEVRGNLDSQSRQVESDVRTAYVQLTSLWEQLDQANQVCALNDQAVKIALNRYKAGLSTSTEWLTAQSNWNTAQQDRIQLQANYRQSWADWKRATAAPPPVDLPASALVDWSEPPRLLAPGEYPDEGWLEKDK